MIIFRPFTHIKTKGTFENVIYGVRLTFQYLMLRMHHIAPKLAK
jgi:hypothetical protein